MHSHDATSRTIIEALHANRPGKLLASIESSPDARFEEQGLLPTKCKQSEMPPQRFDFLSHSYHSAGSYRLCSAIAEALYREARRMVDSGCADVGTARFIAGRTAIALTTAEQQLGHHDKVVRLVLEITGWLSTIADTVNLGSLQVKRLESLVELEQFDEAERDIKALQQTVLPPLVQVSLQLLTVRLRKLKANGPELPSGQANTTLNNNPLLQQMFVELIRSAAELAHSKAVSSSGASNLIGSKRIDVVAEQKQL
jgi:hypothetical protein